MFRLHDWRALCATLHGEPLLEPELHQHLHRWREGRPARGLRVFATTLPPLVPLVGPAQVVWEGWAGYAPRRRPPPPKSTFELVPLILSDAHAEALRRQAVDRGLSVAELVAELIDQLERQTQAAEDREAVLASCLRRRVGLPGG